MWFWKNKEQRERERLQKSLEWVALAITGRKETLKDIIPYGDTIPDWELARMALAGKDITGIVYRSQL